MPRKHYPIPGAPQTWLMQLPDGRHVEVTIDWLDVQRMARRAYSNKTRRTTEGPVRIKAPKARTPDPQP